MSTIDNWCFTNFCIQFKKDFPEIASKYFENDYDLQRTIAWYAELLDQYVQEKIAEYINEYKKN